MSTYTEHYKLVKPSYDEDIDVLDINNNMDTIDNVIHSLDFVQNAFTDESGLHLNKRDGGIIDIPLDYLKLTGGNITGDLTVKDNQVISNLKADVSNDNGYVKLSNGLLLQWGTVQVLTTDTAGTIKQITLPIPFANNKYTVITGKSNRTGGQVTSVAGSWWGANFDYTTTGFKSVVDHWYYQPYLNWFAIGKGVLD